MFRSDRVVKDVLPKVLKSSGIRLNFPASFLAAAAVAGAEEVARKNCDKGIRVK